MFVYLTGYSAYKEHAWQFTVFIYGLSDSDIF